MYVLIEMRVVKCISIGIDEAQFLEDHDELNLSELVRMMIKKMMRRTDET